MTPGAPFSKVPRTFRARKTIRKTTTCLFCKAGLFICCKGNKNKNNCKVSCLETPSFWRCKENYVTRNTLETFRDFRETGPWSGNRTRATLVGGECFHFCPIPAPLGLEWSFWVSCRSAIQVNELTVINFTWFIFRGLFLDGLLIWKRMFIYQWTQKHEFDWPFSTYREGFNLTKFSSLCASFVSHFLHFCLF